MNRRNVLIGGLSFAAIAIPTTQVFAKGAQSSSVIQEEELGKRTAAYGAEMEKIIAADPKAPGGKLSTHVLDIMIGKPAVGMRIDFSVLEGGSYKLIKTVYTNSDGRTDELLLTADAMKVGRYQQLFHVADYYTKLGVKLSDPPFIDKVPLQFSIFDAKQKYHVPLLCTPWSYSTYRGS